MNAPASETIARPIVIEMLNATVSSVDVPGLLLVEDVNWRVTLNEFWVIGGLPGSGRSDLLATAAGLQRPSSGVLRLFGNDSGQLNEQELLRARLRIGFVFEMGGRLFNDLTVIENVALPLRFHRNWTDAKALERAAAVLELTGLSALAHSTPVQISQSWRQRVGLARALALEPEVLILNNPLLGLEPRQAAWWLEFLDRLWMGHQFMKDRRMTMVVTTHDLRTWIEPGRQFALMKEKRWLPLGGRDEVMASVDPLVRELLTASAG